MLFNAEQELGGIPLFSYGNINDDIITIINNKLTAYYTKSQTDFLLLSKVDLSVFNNYQIIVDASINSLELNKLDITAFDASWNDLSNNFVSRFGDAITGNYNITGDLYIDGSFTVLGGATFIQTQTVEISDNLLLINSNQTGTPPPTLQSGIEVNRGSENNYQFLFDETSDTFKIGEVGNLQSVATREDTPNNNRVPYWDNTETRFKTDRLITIDNSNNISLGSTPLSPYRLDVRNLSTNDTRVMINDCSVCTTNSNAMLNLFIRENQTKEHIHFRRAFDIGGGTQIKDFGLSIDENAGLTVGKYDNNGNYEELLYVNENHTIEVDGGEGGDFVIVGTPNISLSGVNTNLSTNYYTKTQTDTLLNGKSNVGHTHAISDIINLQTSLDGKLNLTGGTIAPSIPVFPVLTLLTIDNGNLDIINNGKLLIGGVDVLGNIDASINAIDESKWTTNGNDIYNNNSGNVGIGTTNPEARLDISSNLGDVATNETVFLRSRTKTPGNVSYLRMSEYRHTAGNSWTGTQIQLYRRVDASDMGKIIFSPVGDDVGLAFCSGFGSTERMRIDNDGNVGIGTTSPNYTLEVNGSFGATTIHNTDTTTPIKMITSNLNTTGIEDIGIRYENNDTYRHDGISRDRNLLQDYNTQTSYINAGIYTRTYNTDGTGIYSFQSRARVGLVFKTRNLTDYQTRMVITNTGNVGIGTTLPLASLHIEKSSNYPELYINYEGGQKAGLLTGTQGTLLGYSGYLDIGTITGANATGLSTKMRITSTGNVGVGLTNPTSKFHVNSSTMDLGVPGERSDALLSIGGKNDISNNTYIAFVNPSITDQSIPGMYWWSSDILFGRKNNTAFWGLKETHAGALGKRYKNFIEAQMVDSGGYNWCDNIRFLTNSTGNAQHIERMRITNNGNVGIGTTNPNEKFVVNGRIVAYGAPNATLYYTRTTFFSTTSNSLTTWFNGSIEHSRPDQTPSGTLIALVWAHMPVSLNGNGNDQFEASMDGSQDNANWTGMAYARQEYYNAGGGGGRGQPLGSLVGAMTLAGSSTNFYWRIQVGRAGADDVIAIQSFGNYVIVQIVGT